MLFRSDFLSWKKLPPFEEYADPSSFHMNQIIVGEKFNQSDLNNNFTLLLINKLEKINNGDCSLLKTDDAYYIFEETLAKSINFWMNYCQKDYSQNEKISIDQRFINVSILNIVLLVFSLATNLNALIYSSITLTIILKSLSDSFVAKKNQIVERSFKLIFFDLLKFFLFYFGNFFSGNQLLMLILFLSACPDLKIGTPNYVKPKNKGLVSKNLLSLTKNLESLSIFLFVNNGIVSSSSMVYIQQAVSAINIFLMTKWQKNIHQKNHFVFQYIKDVSAYIIFLGIILGLLGFLYDSEELLILATLVILRTIIIDPNLFMTNKLIRNNISLFYIGIFLSGIISIILDKIFFYYLTVIILMTLIVIKITKHNYIK